MLHQSAVRVLCCSMLRVSCCWTADEGCCACMHRAGDVARVRALALQARFLRAEAMTLHQAGDYSAAVACLLRPPRHFLPNECSLSVVAYE